jgi:hypothetical protein
LDAYADFFWWGISWAWRKEKLMYDTFSFSFHLKVEKETREASIRDNIYKIDKLLWALTWGSSSSSYFSSFRPPERDGSSRIRREVVSGGTCVVKRRDLKVATMCRYNGLITTNI